MDKELKARIEYLLSVKIGNVRPISGGDISKAYLLETEKEKFFCKINSGPQAFQMFQAENASLEAIAETKTIISPKVLLTERLENGALLVMEYVDSKKANLEDLELLGHQLAAMHKSSSSETFGWPTDNFIGSLPQSNRIYSDWVQFYVQERLIPQFKIALDYGLLSLTEIPSESTLLNTCENLFPNVKPSLLHGDLWSGNYLISQKGIPYLIDPAVYFGHHEVDIAMTKLFGGFDAAFYRAYATHFPEIGHEKERCDIYQLYYLLVHLNLFGASYKASVFRILKKHF